MSEQDPPATDDSMPPPIPDQVQAQAADPVPDATPAPATSAMADDESRGLARDFAGYAELEHERRRNSFDDFDAELFAEAVQMVKKKLQV